MIIFFYFGLGSAIAFEILLVYKAIKDCYVRRTNNISPSKTKNPKPKLDVIKSCLEYRPVPKCNIIFLCNSEYYNNRNFLLEIERMPIEYNIGLFLVNDDISSSFINHTIFRIQDRFTDPAFSDHSKCILIFNTSSEYQEHVLNKMSKGYQDFGIYKILSNVKTNKELINHIS